MDRMTGEQTAESDEEAAISCTSIPGAYCNETIKDMETECGMLLVRR